MKNPCDFGLIGLGTMGRNLLLNIAEKGFNVIGYDPNREAVQTLNHVDKTNINGKIDAVNELTDLINSLASPRKIMMLVPAGKIVDSVIADLTPLLDQGDIIIDGGNSFFKDTARRQAQLASQGIHYLGIGISGGEDGARHGPSMMPSGDVNAYNQLKPLLEAIAAQVDGEPCIAYLGQGAAGNYVKMVHNGIEYGIMQILAEVYDIMKRGLAMSNDSIGETFQTWNQGRLKSYLIEILPTIFAAKDTYGDQNIIDIIIDKAQQKGTGKWTSQNALDIGEPVPTIDNAVIARALSALKTERLIAADLFAELPNKPLKKDKAKYLNRLEKATYFAFIITYAQGLALLRSASDEYGYELDLLAVTKIWRAGCIVRAQLLREFGKAYQQNPELTNLLLDTTTAKQLIDTQKSTRKVIRDAIKIGIPTPCLSASLSYFDSYRCARLPTNLIQAQRDLFGAHTYERLDKPGNFHTEWE